MAKKEELARYQQMLRDPFYFEWLDKQYMAELGVSHETIRLWNKNQVDWNDVLKCRRETYPMHTARIDLALRRKAEGGHVDAIKTYYQIFGGWVPSTQVKNVHEVDESAIDEELDRLMRLKKDTADALKPDDENRALAKEMAPKVADLAEEWVDKPEDKED